MISLPFTPGPVPKLGERRTLFQLASDVYLWENDYYTPFDVSPDGRRFLMARRIEATTAGRAPLVVVDNWFTELRQRLAGQ
jgi:hypothetical protein